MQPLTTLAEAGFVSNGKSLKSTEKQCVLANGVE
jgi:hypothetical protein